MIIKFHYGKIIDMSNKVEKTNAMRILDQKKIPYVFHDNTAYPTTVGTEVADYMKVDRGAVFKTLVTVGAKGEHYVFMIPVSEELDLKKAAKVSSEKNIEMIKSKELLPLTGYIHGGCSPIGMKKQFKTFINATAKLYDKIYFSGGKIGYQLEMSSIDLNKVVDIKYEDLIVNFEIEGIVIHGNGLGKTVGMPTANIDYDNLSELIKNGVYATKVYIDDKEYNGVTNIGTKPTVGENEKVNVETYIMDFSEDIYGKNIKIKTVAFIRDIKKFDSLNDVKKQVDIDIEKVKTYT